MYNAYLRDCARRIEELKGKINEIEEKKHEIRLNSLRTDMELNEMKKFSRLNKNIHSIKLEIKRINQILENVDYKLFRKVLEEFNLKAVDMMLNGGKLHMGNRLGVMNVLKVPRNHEKPTIDWGKTNAYKKKTGKKKLFYYTDDWWVRWYWNKHRCVVPSKSLYKYKPSRGKKGMVTKLKNHLRNDKLAHTKFEAR